MIKEDFNKKNKKIIALYIRLSSADEDVHRKKESNSIVNQRKYLREFLRDFLDGKSGTKEFENSQIIEFVDDGYTATNDNRPSLKAMLEMARKKEIDTIIVRDFSRFFRDYIEAGRYIEKEFPTLGVRFISVNDNYDSNNFIGTTGGMEMVIRNIVYSAYSKDLSVKVKSAKKQMMKEGKFIGGFPPYGYIKNPEDKHKLIVDNAVSKNVERIFDLALQGCKLSRIANILNVENIETPRIYRNRLYNIRNKENIDLDSWKYSTIYRVLTNEVYIGNMVNGKEKKENLYAKKVVNKENIVIVENTHKAIVGTEKFEKAQEIIVKKNEKVLRNYELYPLKSLVKCGKCNKSLRRAKRKNISNVYECRNCKSLNKEGNFYVKEDELEKVVLNIILKYIEVAKEKNSKVEDRKNDYKEKEKEKEKEVEILKLEKFELYKKYVGGNITEEIYLHKKDNIDKYIKALTTEINNILENKNQYNIGDKESLDNINTSELTCNMTHNFIEKIVAYDEERFEIVMKFGRFQVLWDYPEICVNLQNDVCAS